MSTDYAKHILIRIAWGIVIAFIILIIGAMVGYGLGGGNPFKVFLPSTWTHILDFLK